MDTVSRIERLNYMKDLLVELETMAFNVNEVTLGYILQTAILELQSLERNESKSKKSNALNKTRNAAA